MIIKWIKQRKERKAANKVINLIRANGVDKAEQILKDKYGC